MGNGMLKWYLVKTFIIILNIRTTINSSYKWNTFNYSRNIMETSKTFEFRLRGKYQFWKVYLIRQFLNKSNIPIHDVISQFSFSSSRIWNPDILMYHSASEEFDSTYPVNIVVYQDGKCKYGPPAIFQSTCQVYK